MENEFTYRDADLTGLPVCEKCGTPKEVIVLGKRTPCLCKCESEAERKRLCGIITIAEERKRACFTDCSALAKHTFESDETPAFLASRAGVKFAETFGERMKTGRGLVFYGPVGTGKTFLASAICNRVIEKGYTARMLSFPDVTYKLSRFDRQTKDEAESAILSPDLVVFDDFGAEPDSEPIRESVFKAINMRLLSGKPYVLTTNKRPSWFTSFAPIEEERITSRICGSADFIEVGGRDRRMKSRLRR